jgi:hypothetical protein
MAKNDIKLPLICHRASQCLTPEIQLDIFKKFRETALAGDFRQERSFVSAESLNLVYT